MKILLHDDWEIYGDGSGNPILLMFDPASRLLDICDQYGAKYTFYAEIGQQLNMLNSSESKWRTYAAQWETILKDAISRGHDVQLHFHPQWIGAKLKTGSWKLNHQYWNTGNVEAKLLSEWIGKGKNYLENLLKPLASDYCVCSYRAGGWMCQPSESIYDSLKEHGITSDSSIIMGRYRKYEDGGKVDFRYAKSNTIPWEVCRDDFSKEKKESGIWELPVYSETSHLPLLIYLLKKSFRPGYYYKIYNAIKRNSGSVTYSPAIIKIGKPKEYYGSLGYMHYNHLLSYVKKCRKNKNVSDKLQHLVFMTHSKNFLDYSNFEKFLLRLSRYEDVEFSTTRSFVKNYISANQHKTTNS